MDETEKLEIEAQVKGEKLNADLAQRRLILTADQLAHLVSPRARFEQEFAIDGAGKRPYFFSIDGVLNGKKISGAMFAAECILVSAENFLIAQELANQGLRATQELLFQEYETRKLRLADETPMVQGLANEVAGRRMKDSGKPALHDNPFLKSVLASELGGLPWK